MGGMGYMPGMATAGIGAIAGLGQIFGALFRKKPKKIKLNEFAPHAIHATNLAKRRAMQTVAPGQNQAENRFNRATSNTLSAIRRNTTSSSQALNALGTVSASQNRFMQDLNALNQQFRYNNSIALENAYNRLNEANMKLRAFNEQRQLNYQQNRAAQISGGVNTLVNSAAMGESLMSGGSAGTLPAQPQAQVSPYVDQSVHQSMMSDLRGMNDDLRKMPLFYG